MDDHNGAGEEVGFIDPAPNGEGHCVCGLHNTSLGVALALRFRKEQLPTLTNWQHWGKGEYVTGLEPGTNPPIGQAAARKQQQLIFIQPGESKSFDLDLEVFDNEKSIHEFLTKNNF